MPGGTPAPLVSFLLKTRRFATHNEIYVCSYTLFREASLHH